MFTETSNITVFGKLLWYWKYLLTSCSKRLHMPNLDTILESHERLDKTVYNEISVKDVSC